MTSGILYVISNDGVLYKYRVKGEWFKIEQKELDLIKMNCEAMGGILITDEVTDVIDEQINIDQENEDETVKERTFSYEGKEYIARLYKHKDDSYIFGGIFYGNSKCQNMKNIVREYLKACGKSIPLDASVNTHKAVKILIQILDEKK